MTIEIRRMSTRHNFFKIKPIVISHESSEERVRHSVVIVFDRFKLSIKFAFDPLSAQYPKRNKTQNLEPKCR